MAWKSGKGLASLPITIAVQAVLVAGLMRLKEPLGFGLGVEEGSRCWPNMAPTSLALPRRVFREL